ncbi:beta-1,3-galactosyltransferase 1-like [Mercenaria mercenaria]|uniref:beta-1,3-galactosyltransferase 1-like n=1 Tax=Mercenaria mercenaria TaxID=6596 RepID=UPI001E1DA90B|nr:beta-1,3-galactosyltransferase 1-like [Mercenaria mercenaria]
MCKHQKDVSAVLILETGYNVYQHMRTAHIYKLIERWELISSQENWLLFLCSVHVFVLMFMFYSNLDISQNLLSKPLTTLIESKNENLESKKVYYEKETNKTKPTTAVYRHGEVKKGLKYPVEMQPNLTELINWTHPEYPMNVTYLTENEELCSSVKNLTVLVVVNSATDHFDQRQAIRKTWTNDTYYSHLGTVRVLFLLGRNVNPSVQAGVEKEFKKYKDVLQGDFIDAYLNLTHKVVMGYKWLTERCRNAKLIVKSDDDFLVNIFIYFRNLYTSILPTNVYCDYKAGRIFRNKKDKWYVSENHFRGEKFYKPFCKGKFVSMTNDIMPSLYKSATKTPFYPYDDVLLFGYVMHNVQGLKYKTLEEKDMETNNYRAMKCLKEQRKNCSNFIIGATGGKEMRDTWFTILYFKAL